ncbi:HEXXH motif domain-containing protein [Streptomyces collinus]|uniref:HEXXH motif domain-containing protein n=1 Tax=Streptomyces collinus TaxID=42684 RepID=UPI00340937CD
MTARQLDGLSRGEGDAETLAGLVRSERSHRLLALDLVMDVLTARDGVAAPLPAPERAWSLLAAAQRYAPEAVQELLDLPETGLWVGQLLNRLYRPVTSELPLWADVGHLHCLAAAAAVRAGLDFTFPVPCISGRIDLPTLGQIRLPQGAPEETAVLAGRGGLVTATSLSGVVRLPTALHRSAPGWRPLHRAEVRLPGDMKVGFILDDLSRHRIAPPPNGAAQRMAPKTAEELAALLRTGCDLLVKSDAVWIPTVAALLRSVQPMRAHEAFRVRSASSDHAMGGFALSWPDSELACAAAVAHELQHSKLSALAHLFPLLEESAGPQQLFYAPWRDDPRPLRGMLQGIYAFTGVTRFWWGRTRLPHGEYEQLAWFEFALWRDQLAHVLPTVREAPELTETGRRLLEGLSSTVAGWSADAPRDGATRAVVRLAERLAVDHRVLWRLHHVRPCPSHVKRLATAWLDGAEPVLPGRRSLRAEHALWHLDARAVLTRMAVADPMALDKLRNLPDGEEVPGVTGAMRADLLWAAGESSAAEQRYLRSLVAGTAPPSAWAGLRLTLEESGRAPHAVHALSSVPELVSALADRVRRRTGTPADPVELAQWVGQRPADEG